MAGTAPSHDGMSRCRGNAAHIFSLHPLLPGGRLAAPALLLLLPLLLPFLLVGVMAAVEASGGGAEHAMMSGVMAGDAADSGALQAALGVGRMSRERKRRRGEQCGNCFHDEHPQVAIRTDNRLTRDPVPSPAGSDEEGHSARAENRLPLFWIMRQNSRN